MFFLCLSTWLTRLLIFDQLSEALQVASFKDIGSSVNAVVGLDLLHVCPERDTVCTLEQVDWEESAISDRICVRHGVDEDLDKYKRIFNGIDPVLVRMSHRQRET